MMDWLRSKMSLGAKRRNLFVLLSSFLFFSCEPKDVKVFKNQSVGPALGTSYNIIYLSGEELDYQAKIDSVFAAVNHSLSTYIPDSDISRINKGDSTLVVDQMFQEVFQLSKEIYKKTDGYFDPTVGTLVNAWGFGPGGQIQLDSIRVDSLMTYVGFHKVDLTRENTVRKENPNIYFDFNAIAKGYAVDRLAVLMDKKGIENYLLEVGGEVVTKGTNIADKRRWGVAVQDPEAERMKTMLYLKDRAMASSGNYRKFRIDSVTGKKYVHTIDPTTGFTKNGSTLGTNVLAGTCAEADAYATAFMAMDVDKAISFLKNQKDLDGYIIYSDENGDTQEFMTDGFKESLFQ